MCERSWIHLGSIKKITWVVFFQDFVFAKTLPWSLIIHLFLFFFSFWFAVIQKVTIFNRWCFSGTEHFCLDHSHQQRTSKVFYITDAAQTNPIEKVTKSCHNIELPILIFFQKTTVKLGFDPQCYFYRVTIFSICKYINLKLTCNGLWIETWIIFTSIE